MTEPASRKLLDFQSLVDLSMGERFYDFTLNKQECRLQIRPLTGDESSEIDKIDASIVAPKKPNSQEYDENDPVYLDRLAALRRRKRVLVFRRCLKDFHIDGETLDAQVKSLYGKLPIGIIEGLYSAILEITANPIEGAVFTSTGSSEASPAGV